MRFRLLCLLLILKCDTETIVELFASRFNIDNSIKSSSCMILELISYGSFLMLSISIISVMECMPCPLVLMAASVMDPHCIAAKSWLNNLPLLWLERLSQLFNDVSVLEGKRTHTGAHTHTLKHTHTQAHAHTDRLTDGLRHTHSRDRQTRTRTGTRQTKRIRHQLNSWTDFTGRKHQRRHCQDNRDRMQHTDA